MAGTIRGGVGDAIPGARACTNIVWKRADRHAVDCAPSSDVNDALGGGVV